MAGIVLTEKFADKVDERHTPNTVTAFGTNQDYDFDGARTVKVTSVGVAGMTDYDSTKGYGAVADAENAESSVQIMTITKDRSFRIKLDELDEADSVVKSGQMLARQIREVVAPEVEAYRLGIMTGAVVAGNIITATASPYDDFLKAQEVLDDNDVPEATRVAFASPAFINSVKSQLVKETNNTEIAVKGYMGHLDSTPIIKTSKKWLGEFECLIADRGATVAPMKLEKFRVVLDHPDFDGAIVQGRVAYDAFVLNNKKVGLSGIKKAITKGK
ncbi:MAG: hypothetical protein ACRCXX_11750 [Cetobacterium sp.]|uniref:hypothetical protein n=1 Tax=Cetobacterium sp. TaxID=2071632 RepID=UPI003F2DCA6A